MTPARIAILGVLAAVRAAAAPVPPPVPGGFADAPGRVGVFAGEGRVIAADLDTGATVWTETAGRWPLASRAGWVAVAAPDPADPRAFRIRFLRPSDGAFIRRTGPVRIPGFTAAGDAVADDASVVFGTMRSALTIRARVDDRRSRLRLSWESRTFVISGIRPSEPASPPLSGLVIVDPDRGTYTAGPAKSASVLDAPPVLPDGWRPEPGRMYWRGGSWGDRPYPLRTEGRLAFFSCTTDTSRVLRLHGSSPGGPWTAAEIERGGSYVPDPSMDGRFLALHEATTGRGTTRLYDLADPAAPVRLATLPDLPEPVRPPFVVRGRLLLRLAEARGDRADGRTGIRRRLDALDWTTGRIAWTLALAPRYEDDPVPTGSRRPRGD